MPQPQGGPLSTKTSTYILLGIAALLMPVSAAVGGTAQWILIGVSGAFLVLCAYSINANNRRSGRS
ncbi:hypothetical protein [Streptomyces sp. JJ38]|uniref:hypothetical protein n=1 Tax=Streptomyces sp. JJ38 TaxID=2738128 RepID=UPI001C587B01|nr:hypothetical protein [Streptomyces sp. JJ38]MBW1596578.1 hypothetical protein [Streptomyces sp. JJ38]